MKFQGLKASLFEQYHAALANPVKTISSLNETHQNKAKQVNKMIAEMQGVLAEQMTFVGSDHEKQQSLLVIQYCTSVVSLEYRHMVWPYEYMALSRRVGELWERFCRAAWDHPSRANVSRMDAPKFSDVSHSLRGRLQASISEDYRMSAFSDIDALLDLVGEINMKEDEMFLLDGTPHIIDFKSGFGSNEKGNTLRLQTVGRAYKIWNPNTKLFLLVRQEQNNNYLNVIKRSGLWDVLCGDAAYSVIDELSGSNTLALRREIIDFQADLSDVFWSDLSSHLSDLTAYLKW